MRFKKKVAVKHSRHRWTRAVVFIVLLSWAFYGLPQFFNIPPKVENARAATANVVPSAKHATSDTTTETLSEITSDNSSVNPDTLSAVAAGDGTYTVDQSKVMYFIDFDTAAIPTGSTISAASLNLQYGGENGYNGTASVRYNNGGGLTNTTITPSDITGFSAEQSYNLYSAGVDTLAEVAAVDIEFTNGDTGGADAIHFDYLWITITYTAPIITVSTGGTQTANVNLNSSDNLIGYFTFVRNASSANVTSITVNEEGTVNANSHLSNLDIRYETAATCTYDGAETLFGTDTAFDASDIGVVTGTMSVGTSQICVYLVVDVSASATDLQTLDFQINDPSTEVVVASGTVTPGTAVAISGSTTLRGTPNLNQAVYKWFSNAAGTPPNDVSSNTIDTATVDTATKFSFQRKISWDSINSLWWAFYHNGSAIEYSSSPDLSTWTSRGTVAVNSNDFSVWGVSASTTVYLATVESGSVVGRKGVMGATSITWDSARGVDSSGQDSSVSVTRATDGKVWFSWFDSSEVGPGSGAEGVFARRSTVANNLDAFDSRNQVNSENKDDNSQGNVTMAPLTTSGDVYFNWTVSDDIGDISASVEGRMWDDSGSALTSIVTAATLTATLMNETRSVLSLTASATDQAHLLYFDNTAASGSIYYVKYSSGSWGTAVQLDSDTANQYPTISMDATNSEVHAFWLRAGAIYTKKAVSPYASGNWETSATTVDTAVTADWWVTSVFSDGNSYVPLLWADGELGSDNVRAYGRGVGSGVTTDIGSALAATSTAATLSSTGQAFRLRMLYHVTNAQLGQSLNNYKLKFATDSGGTCGAYSDVTTATSIAYKDNGGAADGAALTANEHDILHSTDTIRRQTYEEANNFTNSQSNVSVGEDGMWDFALYDKSAAAGTTYCFKTVTSADADITTYTVTPKITTATAGAADLTWVTGAADFEIWESSSLTWDAGTLKCGGTLTDDNAATVSCSSANINHSTQYRVQVVLKNSGSSDATMDGSSEYIDHKNIKGGWAGTSPTLGTCDFNDLGSDDTATTACTAAYNGNDVRLTETGSGSIKLALTSGQQGYMYLITTDNNIPNTNSTSYLDTSIDSITEDSSKVTITGAFYLNSGTLWAASIDTDSYPTIRNKNVLRASWTQTVPTNCTLQLYIRGTNTGPTPDYSTSTPAGPYTGSGTTVVQDLTGVAALQGKRYYQYYVTMGACTNGVQIPLLSSITFDFD